MRATPSQRSPAPGLRLRERGTIILLLPRRLKHLQPEANFSLHRQQLIAIQLLDKCHHSVQHVARRARLPQWAQIETRPRRHLRPSKFIPKTKQIHFNFSLYFLYFYDIK